MKLRYRSIALADLVRIHDYVAQDNPAAAKRVIRRIEKAIDRLRVLPLSGRPGAVKGTRILVVPGLPYVAIYRSQKSSLTSLPSCMRPGVAASEEKT